MAFEILRSTNSEKRANKMLTALLRTHPQLRPYLMAGLDVSGSHAGEPNSDNVRQMKPRKSFAVYYDFTEARNSDSRLLGAHATTYGDLGIFLNGFDAASSQRG